jgi:glycosyltransferase involved in cell wall biosynthesis
VIPNGIFTQQYHQYSGQLDLGPHVLTFTGKMDYRPNVDAMLWFASNVLPLVRAKVPDIRLYIVGQKPHRRLEPLRDQHEVFLTGWVPDVAPFLHATDVYVAPLRMGSGTRLKILEAMAAGCAIVATSLAAAGLPDAIRQTMVIADNESAMAEAVVSLLQDADYRRTLGKRAQAAVRQYFDWSILIPQLLAVYKGIGLG